MKTPCLSSSLNRFPRAVNHQTGLMCAVILRRRVRSPGIDRTLSGFDLLHIGEGLRARTGNPLTTTNRRDHKRTLRNPLPQRYNNRSIGRCPQQCKAHHLRGQRSSRRRRHPSRRLEAPTKVGTDVRSQIAPDRTGELCVTETNNP